MDRYVVLFAREPARQAHEKGLRSPAAEALFREFARGWTEAADLAGARLVLAAPREDRAAWARSLAGVAGVAWLAQRGPSLGTRLEDAVRRTAALGGHAVVVGGDVPPASTLLREAFEGLEAGMDAAISPAPDGGVSLLAMRSADADLLRGIRPRRRTVRRDLLRALLARGRRVRLLPPATDVDGRASLRRLVRGEALPVFLVLLARRALQAVLAIPAGCSRVFSPLVLHGSPSLRGPPISA